MNQELRNDKSGQSFQTDQGVNYWLSTGDKRTKILGPTFKNFDAFVEDYWGNNPLNPSWVQMHEFTVNDKRIAVIGLNSAIMCGHSESDHRNIVIGEPQVDEAIAASKEFDLRICVVHHPFHWLTEFDQNRVVAKLMSHCHFVLHGHQHQQRVEIIKSSMSEDAETVFVTAGSSFAGRYSSDPHYMNGYNLVSIDLEKRIFNVFLREWDGRSAWKPDSSVTGGSFSSRLPTKSLTATPYRSSQIREQGYAYRQCTDAFGDLDRVILDLITPKSIKPVAGGVDFGSEDASEIIVELKMLAVAMTYSWQNFVIPYLKPIFNRMSASKAEFYRVKFRICLVWTDHNHLHAQGLMTIDLNWATRSKESEDLATVH